MYASNHLTVMSAAFPDVCKTPTPVGPVPIPYPNVAMAPTAGPTVRNVFMGCSPVQNLFGVNPVTNFDQAGAAMGLVSNQIAGMKRTVLGSVSTCAGCAPVTRLTSLTTHNGMPPNAVGIDATPGQVRVAIGK